MIKQIRVFFLIFISLTLPGPVFAMVNIDSNGISGSGFPVALTSSGETYQLSEDINCGGTCFTVKNNNIRLDLNGHIATFGSLNNPNLLNTEMESWVDNNNLADWQEINGSVSRVDAQVWGNFDAELSPTAILKSSTVNLISNQTYNYYSVIKGSSFDSYVISIRNALDDTVLASNTIGGSLLSRAFAMSDGSLLAEEHSYKPVTDMAVYLQIECIGDSVKRLHVADIKPSRHYFLASYNYRNTALFPDLADGLFGGSSTGLIIENGTINQGPAKAVKSAAIYSSVAQIKNINIKMSGNNSSSVVTKGSFVIDALNVNTESILNFNRMHAPSSLDFLPESSGAIEIKNSTFINDPEQAVQSYYTYLRDSDTHTTLIHDNIIRNKEQVTEGYAIALSGVGNVSIYNNDINPFQGRGILLDAVANRSGYLDGTKNITISNNQIRNIHEYRNAEYDQTGLEAAGIRIRDWGSLDPPDGHRNLKIFGNNISVFVDSIGTHRSYGISMTSPSAFTDADIYNNTITANVNSSLNSDWEAACIALQGVDMSSGGAVIVRNNLCTGNVGVRFGGNDGFNVKNVELFENEITTNKANILYYGYQGPFQDNSIYCNKFNNTSSVGYNVYFDDGTPSMSNQYFSHNLLQTSNDLGYEFFLNKNYTASITGCENGELDIFGGGLISTASMPCSLGSNLCYNGAGLLNSDTTAPSSPVGLIVE